MPRKAPDKTEDTTSTEDAPKARTLARTVIVGGKGYPAGSEVPPDVAEKITNPSAWGE